MEHIDTPAGAQAPEDAEDAQSAPQAPQAPAALPSLPSRPHTVWPRRVGRPVTGTVDGKPIAPFWPESRRKRLRALMMVKDSLTMTDKQVGKKYGVSIDTVRRTLSYAKRAEIFTELEDEILGGLAPKAQRVLEAAMAENVDGSRSDGIAEALPSKRASQVALKVLEGTGVLRKAGQKSPSDPSGAQESELTKYIQQRRQRALEAENTHDGAIVEHAIQQHLGGAGDGPGISQPLRLPPATSEFPAPLDQLAGPGGAGRDPLAAAVGPRDPSGLHEGSVQFEGGHPERPQGSDPAGIVRPDGHVPAPPREGILHGADEDRVV